MPVAARPRTPRGTPPAVVLALTLVAAVAAVAASLALGSRSFPLPQVWDALVHGGTSDAAVVVRRLRLPRTMVGLLVGAALGLAGALMQALTRNPLADPGLLGVEAGAAAAVVTAVATLGLTAPGQVVWFGLAGAGVAAVVVHLVGTGAGAGRAGADPVRLVLAGAAVSAVLYAYVEAVVLLDYEAFRSFRSWRYGAIAGRTLGDLEVVAPLMLLGVGLGLALAPALNALALGDDAGRGVGVHLRRTRVLGALAVTLLCGAATAVAGPVAFVGLAVPYVARLLVGVDLRWVLAVSVPLGAAMLLGADVVGRLAGSPGEVSVGIVTAALGGPLFVLLVRRRRIPRL